MKNLKTKCLFIASIIVIINGCSKQIVPLENSHLKVTSYTDATGDHGNSVIDCVQNNEIKFNYTLKPGFSYPYAGVSIATDSGLLDLHKYDYLDIVLSADTTCAVNVYLKTVQDSCTIPGNYLTYRFLEQTLWINNKPCVYRIDIRSMKTPDWWYTVNKKNHNLSEQNLRKVNNFDIATSSIYLERPGFIHVYKMKLIKNFIPLITRCFICIVIVFVSGTAWLLIANSRKPRIIPYQKLNNEGLLCTEDERLRAYIGKCYNNSDLSLEIVGKETGVHWTRVSSIIKKKHNLTFKQYLNKIRIAEAKRLLKETDRQILDIALTVGYGNVSHFNRVFKEYESCSPRVF